jgi:hypothetical protein
MQQTLQTAFPPLRRENSNVPRAAGQISEGQERPKYA